LASYNGKGYYVSIELRLAADACGLQIGTPMLVDLICHFWRNDPSLPFRVKLHDLALRHLMADAAEAYRVYELMCIQRPGDVWKYVWVELLDVPKSVHSSRDWRKQNNNDAYKWPENWLPLAEFDRCFYWAYDDTTPESNCWLPAREGQTFKDWADELFAKVKTAQAAVRESADVLVKTELARMDLKRHAFDYDAKTPLELTRQDYRSRVTPCFGPGFYEKLRELLGRSEVTCVSFLVEDYQAVRQAFMQQRLRSSPDPLTRANRWPICILADKVYGTKAWNGEIQIQSEGIGFGFLLVSTHASDHLLNCGRFRWLLCAKDAGNLAGYRHTAGDDWHLYEDLSSEEEFAKASEMWRERIAHLWKIEL
jgi:hypothetical protein